MSRETSILKITVDKDNIKDIDICTYSDSILYMSYIYLMSMIVFV